MRTNVGAGKQRVQVSGDLGSVLRAVRCVASAASGAVIHADLGVGGYGRCNPAEI
jgi:hypothetical protein